MSEFPRPSGQPQRPSREPVFNLSPVIVFFIAVCAGLHLLRLYVLDTEQDIGLLIRMAFIPERYSGQYLLDVYAFTSPVTYSLLHGGWAHLAINMVWMAAFGSPLANRIGTIRTVLFWVVASLAAALLHYLVHPNDPSPLVGASGAISGMMGAAARFNFQVDRGRERPAFAGRRLTVLEALSSRTVAVFLAIWFVINLVSGLGYLVPGEAAIAWEAHIGGFLVGFFAIGFFDRRPWR